jgi:acid phosphatase (class A)
MFPGGATLALGAAMRATLGLIGVLAAGLAGAAWAQGMAPTSGPVSGYLAAGDAPDAIRILPPPPAAGSGREADDRAIFAATRALKGDPRWDLATSDADLHPANGMADFACALGVTLTPETAPTVASLFARISKDARAVIDPPKARYARPRPYLADANAPICVDKTDDLAKSASYPSGHATQSWAWGLVLAELVPDRATEILMRARSIGESRVVCGVHYMSDIEAGRDAGSALVARLHADAAFQADLAKAREEIRAARETPHVGPEACLIADQAAAHPPY